MSKPGGDPSSGISSGEPCSLPERHPACRRREAQPGSCTERENLSLRCQGRRPSGANRKDQSTEAEHRGGAVRSRDEGSVMELDRRGCVVQPSPRANRRREEPADKAKPFDIPKREVWEEGADQVGTATRIGLRPHDPRTGEEIAKSEVVKGYE